MTYITDSKFRYAINTPAYNASFKNVDSDYIYSCENNGKCRAVRFLKETGEEYINLGPVHTHRKAVRDSDGKLEYVDVLVCNECFLPVNSTAAKELNEWLGIRLEQKDDLLDSIFSEMGL